MENEYVVDEDSPQHGIGTWYARRFVAKRRVWPY